MRGTVCKVLPTFGFIMGTDGIQRFFIPGTMLNVTDFDLVKIGHVVDFEHVDHPKGPRAISVRFAGVVEDDH